MLNPIPELLVLSFVAPTVLRLFLGGAFLYLGVRALSRDRAEMAKKIGQVPLSFGPALIWASLLGLIQIVAALMLLLGFYVQIAAIAIALTSIKVLFWRMFGGDMGQQGNLFYLLSLAISVSLLFTGAGLLAFDLPF